MLYDPKWEQQTKADPFMLSEVIQWLEKQPADKTYCYGRTGECLIAQYLIERGHRGVIVGGVTVDFDGSTMRLPGRINYIAVSQPHTFGAALERARAAR